MHHEGMEAGPVGGCTCAGSLCLSTVLCVCAVCVLCVGVRREVPPVAVLRAVGCSRRYPFLPESNMLAVDRDHPSALYSAVRDSVSGNGVKGSSGKADA